MGRLDGEEVKPSYEIKPFRDKRENQEEIKRKM